MIAAKLASKTIPPLHTTDTVRVALGRMLEFKLYHLPVVDGKQFVGMISEEELKEETNPDILLSSINIRLSHTFTFDNAHILEVLRLFGEWQLSIVPVLNQKRHFLGTISINKLLSYTANLFAVKEPGAIIVLAISDRNNSLVQIAQIVEIENAQILSSFVNSYPNSTRMEVTLKINKTDVSAIVAAFERYEYEVKSIFNNSGVDDGFIDRYNSFMNYLNV